MDELRLTEQLMTASEFADVLRVGEDDVLEWMLAGYISCEDGASGEPRVRVASQYEVDGPLSSGVIQYTLTDDPQFQAELARRRRDRELADLDWGDVALRALADALRVRLQKAVPAGVEVSAAGDAVSVLDAQGHGVVIDLAFHASVPEAGSDADRVRSAALGTLQRAQDELTMATTDPWPRRKGSHLPTPRAVLSSDATTLRLLYGDLTNPVLELEPLVIADVLV